MKVTVDASGRVTIPDAIQQLASIHPGSQVDVRWRDGYIQIDPDIHSLGNGEPALVRKGPFLVAHMDTDGPSLTVSVVEALRESLRDDRRTELR